MSFKFTILNIASSCLIVAMIYFIWRDSSMEGGDGLVNFFPMVGIISGIVGLVIDQILQAYISDRKRLNLIETIVILGFAAYVFYVLKH